MELKSCLCIATITLAFEVEAWTYNRRNDTDVVKNSTEKSPTSKIATDIVTPTKRSIVANSNVTNIALNSNLSNPAGARNFTRPFNLRSPKTEVYSNNTADLLSQQHIETTENTELLTEHIITDYDVTTAETETLIDENTRYVATTLNNTTNENSIKSTVGLDYVNPSVNGIKEDMGADSVKIVFNDSKVLVMECEPLKAWISHKCYTCRCNKWGKAICNKDPDCNIGDADALINSTAYVPTSENTTNNETLLQKGEIPNSDVKYFTLNANLTNTTSENNSSKTVNVRSPNTEVVDLNNTAEIYISKHPETKATSEDSKILNDTTFIPKWNEDITTEIITEDTKKEYVLTTPETETLIDPVKHSTRINTNQHNKTKTFDLHFDYAIDYIDRPITKTIEEMNRNPVKIVFNESKVLIMECEPSKTWISHICYTCKCNEWGKAICRKGPDCNFGGDDISQLRFVPKRPLVLCWNDECQ